MTEAAFDDWVVERGPGLVRLARGLLSDLARAEAVVQSVLARLLVRWPRASDVEELDLLARRMVIDACGSVLTRWPRRQHYARGQPGPDSACDGVTATSPTTSLAVDAARLVGLMSGLSRSQRSVLVLRYYEQMPDMRIARVLGISEASVRSTAQSGLAALRSKIEGGGRRSGRLSARWGGRSAGRGSLMNATGDAGPDRDLGEALSRGLSRALDVDVDPASIVRGARLGAQRIVRRRAAARRGLGALVVVGLLPVGASLIQGLDPGASSGLTTAGGAAAESARASPAITPAAGSPPPGRSEPTGSMPASTLDAAEPGLAAPQAPPMPRGTTFSSTRAVRLAREGGEITVPQTAMLANSDLGLDPVVLLDDVSGAARTPSDVAGLCGPGAADTLARGGRMRVWVGAAGGQEGWAVASVVRVFSGNGATDEVARLRRDVGACPSASEIPQNRGDMSYEE